MDSVPIDEVLSNQSRYLYAFNSGTNEIVGFRCGFVGGRSTSIRLRISRALSDSQINYQKGSGGPGNLGPSALAERSWPLAFLLAPYRDFWLCKMRSRICWRVRFAERFTQRPIVWLRMAPKAGKLGLLLPKLRRDAIFALVRAPK